MFDKITAFFLAIVLFICNLFGIECKGEIFTETENSYYFQNLAYGSHERHKLDLYIPKNSDGEVGLVLMIHGGAWVGGDKSAYSDYIKIWADKGYAAATINYRYLSYDVSFDDILDDIESALHKIKNTGTEYGVNINKMLLSGHSAGGHLSMLYPYARKSSSPIDAVAVVNCSGPTDLLDPNFYNENANDALKELYRQIASLCYGEELTLENAHLANDILKKHSPLYYVDEHTIPTVINHGMKDDIVPFSNALSLEAKFKELSVTHIMNIYPNSGHGLESDPEAAAKADEYFALYVETYLN